MSDNSEITYRKYAHRKWQFTLTIPEGRDEFFEGLTDENEIAQITDLIERAMEFYGFYNGEYGFKIKGEKIS